MTLLAALLASFLDEEEGLPGVEPISFTDGLTGFAIDIMAQGIGLRGRIEICRTMRVTA
ncbi:hypothetical protein AGR7A_pTi0098 [Agrobacterium deltaense NCPPB 1641]|uniref:Uncharacterized protein n=1 Tax=Agrobacterium deltaense NCPPB 1641 TaxID=1183425 RepID=A0A1S7UBY1_9HYPH|nr:hypothetical protein AGR7A_pTi0098 [Agrobacterium deltaense NCPPB 1641]